MLFRYDLNCCPVIPEAVLRPIQAKNPGVASPLSEGNPWGYSSRFMSLMTECLSCLRCPFPLWHPCDIYRGESDPMPTPGT